MKKLVVFLFLFSLSIISISAQIRAITQDGKLVELHKNGTWNYIMDSVKTNNSTNVIDAKNPIAEEIIPSNIVKAQEVEEATELSVLQDFTSDQITLLNDEGRILSKYFSINNQILCKAQIEIKNGKGALHTIWKVNTNEPMRYYGVISPEKTFDLALEGGVTLKLKLASEEKIYGKALSDKHPIAEYTATYMLTPTDTDALRKHGIISGTMTWKRDKEETYKVADRAIFLNILGN